MTINRGLFVRQLGKVGTTPKEARLALAGLYAENAPGVPRNGVMFQGAVNLVSGNTDMSYSVAACEVVYQRTAGEGVYTPTFTGTTNIGTGAAPGSGFRYDIIWAYQHDIEKTDPDNLAVLGVTQGVAASSPVRPAIPTGAYALAEALVSSGATATNGAGVTITQLWRHTVARGASIPVRNDSELAEITGKDGQHIVRLDQRGQRFTCFGGTWYADGPFAMSAGIETFGLSSSSATHAVTFPAGRFTQPPVVTLGKAMSSGGRIIFAAVSVTKDGFTMYAQTADGASATVTCGVEWSAVQMTATSGVG